MRIMTRTRLCMAPLAIAMLATTAHAQHPRARFVKVHPDVTLEVLDWGGAGPSLVFLAGGGNTAHVFDTFAPRFTDRFHAIGITRRGFGASAGALPPRDLDTLVADITAVLDTLSIEHVILVGHSIAGEEMTRFAELHGNRCAGLIYLDAAYDRSRIDSIAKGQPPTPAPRIRNSDTASLASLWAFHVRVLGAREPESEIRAGNRFDEHGKFKGEVTPTALKGRLASGKRTARYHRVRCPALAIYARPDSAVDVVPYYAELDAGGRANAEALLRFVQAYVNASRSQFARSAQHVTLDFRGNHYLFLQHPDEVATAMRSFLSALIKRASRRAQHP
jgi:non-heme chloroperoxidase